MNKYQKIGIWLLSRDTGLSSKAIVSKMLGAPATYFRHPLDPADLGRCIRLLNFIPEFRDRLGEMKDCSPHWAVLVEHWEELEKLYWQEEPSGRAHTCVALGRELLDSVK